MYGEVPPAVVAVQVKALPEVWPVPQLTEFVTGWPPTAAVADPVAVTAFALLAVLLIE